MHNHIVPHASMCIYLYMTYISVYLYIYITCSTYNVSLYMLNTIIIGERSEPHTYRTVGKNLRHIYIYVFYIYIYIYIYIRSYVVHVPLTRALRANVGPAG